MTIPLDLILSALAGLILGFLGGWLVSSGRTRQAVALAVAESERGSTATRLGGRGADASRRHAAGRASVRRRSSRSSRSGSELQARMFAQETDIRPRPAIAGAPKPRRAAAAELAKEREGYRAAGVLPGRRGAAGKGLQGAVRGDTRCEHRAIPRAGRGQVRDAQGRRAARPGRAPAAHHRPCWIRCAPRSRRSSRPSRAWNRPGSRNAGSCRHS